MLALVDEEAAALFLIGDVLEGGDVGAGGEGGAGAGEDDDAGGGVVAEGEGDGFELAQHVEGHGVALGGAV